MTGLQKAILDTLRPVAVEAATNPNLHSAMSKHFGSEPINREWVVARYGEAAAMAWDDIRAATNSFYREAARRALYSKEGGE